MYPLIRYHYRRIFRASRQVNRSEMEKETYLGALLLFGVVVFQLKSINAVSFSNFNLDTEWNTYLCANENPIVDKETIIITATGLKPTNLPCIALRKNLKISGKYQISSQLINVGPPTGDRNFGLVFNAEDEKNYDFVYLRLINWNKFF